MKNAVWILTLLMQAVSAFPQVRIPRIFSEGMVLQRGEPIRIWGWAGMGQEVTVSFDGAAAKASAGADGRWMTMLEPRKAGGPYNLEIDGINHVEVRDVFVGDVFLCSGQSNMEMTMGQVKEKYPEVIAKSDNNLIREFKVPFRSDASGPHDNIVAAGHWEAADSNSVLSFSAVAYFFAREAFERYHVPVGLIDNAVGGSPAEAWLSAEGLKEFSAVQAASGAAVQAASGAAVQAASGAAGNGTDSVAERRRMINQPGGLYNGMLAPLAGYTIKAVLWYQGEANVSRAAEYRQLLPLLIFDWRRTWRQAMLPFVFVQLPNFGPVKDQPGESQWAELREAQRLALSLPQTAMAVTIDLGEPDNIHPQDKEDVGKRLFLAAEEAAYGRANFIYSGPMFHGMHIHGDKVHLSFDETASGLIVKNGGELHGFAIAGDDNHFVWAKAQIDGKKVIVWSDQVPHPAAVRYAWADNPVGANLWNRDELFRDGLPASPFEAGEESK